MRAVGGRSWPRTFVSVPGAAHSHAEEAQGPHTHPSAGKTGNPGLFGGWVSDKENGPEMYWIGSHDMTRFQRIESASSSPWAFLILKACQGLVVLGAVSWFQRPRPLGPKSCVPFSEGLPASFPQATCPGATWEASV